MVATLQNYFMVKWSKHHVELWKIKSIFYALYIFTYSWVRNQFGFIWDLHLISYNTFESYHYGEAPLIFVKIKIFSIDTLKFYQTINFLL